MKEKNYRQGTHLLDDLDFKINRFFDKKIGNRELLDEAGYYFSDYTPLGKYSRDEDHQFSYDSKIARKHNAILKLIDDLKLHGLKKKSSSRFSSLKSGENIKFKLIWPEYEGPVFIPLVLLLGLILGFIAREIIELVL